MTHLMRAASTAIKKHGSVRKAAEATGIEPAYLYRLSKGQKANPSDEVAAKLGLTRKWTKNS